MNIFVAILLLIIGLILLWKTGGWSVNNAIRFSKIYQIESFLIGFFLFAISTGLPEIVSAIVSSFKGVPALSAGDLMGSTFVNLSLLLGISAIVAKNLVVEADLRKKLIVTLALILIIMFLVFMMPNWPLLLGLVFLAVYIISFFWLKNGAKKAFSQDVTTEQTHEKLWISNPKTDVLVKLAISLGLLIFSSWVTVIAAVNIAKDLHVPVSIIGGTIIAVGTGLPELTLEIHAVRKKEYSLALGDIFGSSLVNVSFVLGLLLILNPPFDLSIVRPVLSFTAAISILIFLRLAKKMPFSVRDGVILIIMFIFYFLLVALGAFS